MKDIIGKLRSVQKELKNCSEKTTRIPIEMDETNIEINNIIDAFLMTDGKDKLKISNKIAWLLVGFAFNMATYSLRLAEQRYFTNGLAALGIASETIDLKDILRILVLYWDVFKKKDLSFQFAISQNNNFSKELKKFLKREESDKSLECMGFELVGEDQNIQYKQKNN